jgi:hypothetical protein
MLLWLYDVFLLSAREQMLVILTRSVNRCFEKNPKFDMTPLLGGTDAVFSSLIHSFSWFVTLLLACLVSDVLFYVFLVNTVSVWLFQESSYISSCLHLPSSFLCNKASCRCCLARHCWFWCFVCNTDVQAQGLTLLNFYYLYNDLEIRITQWRLNAGD